jgi:hypothetical protein
MLFLGAGASNAFGVGQLQDLTRTVNDIFRGIGYSNIIEQLKQLAS